MAEASKTPNFDSHHYENAEPRATQSVEMIENPNPTYDHVNPADIDMRVNTYDRIDRSNDNNAYEDLP